MLESLRKRMHVLVGKQSRQVCWLWRETPYKFEGLAALEDARNLIARHENRNPPLRAGHPLGKLALRVGVRAIDFI
jgi:hypothetical protein